MKNLHITDRSLLLVAVLLGGRGSDNSAKDAGAPQVLNLTGGQII